MRFILITVIVISGFLPARAQSNPDAILGLWLTGEGHGIVEIYKNGSHYQGKVVWLKEPNDPKTGKPKTDIKHPDESLHSRPILGLVNLWGFVFKGDNKWENGKIYDPKVGKEYKCEVTLKDANTLDVRGYIGISLIGRTDVWKRQAAIPN